MFLGLAGSVSLVLRAAGLRLCLCVLSGDVDLVLEVDLRVRAQLRPVGWNCVVLLYAGTCARLQRCVRPRRAGPQPFSFGPRVHGVRFGPVLDGFIGLLDGVDPVEEMAG
jgi:hypothetical protein